MSLSLHARALKVLPRMVAAEVFNEGSCGTDVCVRTPLFFSDPCTIRCRPTNAPHPIAVCVLCSKHVQAECGRAVTPSCMAGMAC